MGTDQLEDANWADKPLQEAPMHGDSPNQSPAGKMPSLWPAKLGTQGKTFRLTHYSIHTVRFHHQKGNSFWRISCLSYKQTPP